MVKTNSRLDVYLEDRLVGFVFDTTPLSFEYSPQWLKASAAESVGNIPKQPGRHDDGSVLAFFDNLLPEGGLRVYLSTQRQASTVFSLLRELAGDTAGGFVLLPAGETPKAPSYTPTSWAAIAKRLKSATAVAADIKVKDARLSLAGAQDKTLIAIARDGTPMLPRGSSPSTHILKPEIRGLGGKVWSSAANEAIVMRSAHHAGMKVADVFYEPITASCIVKRFDRVGTPPERIARLIQFDLCQLNDTPPEVKYESDGGPGLQQCAQLIRTHSSQPAADLRRLVEWVFFNIYFGNNDSHAKNLSVYQVPGQGVTLTPFYDLMSTRIYPGLSRKFAFAIGGEHRPGNIEARHVTAMAQSLRMRPSFVFGIAENLAKRVPDALAAAIAEIRPDLDHSRAVLAERLERFVLATTRKSVARILKN